ncbi:hypothetical protein BLOT_005128, partial [Blomia tropicalis]
DVKSFNDERNETLFDVIDNYIIEITNQHRENKPKLKFLINGTKIDHIAQNLSVYELHLQDQTKIDLTVIWQTIEICLHYGVGNWYTGYLSNDSHWPMDSKKFLNRTQFNNLLEFERYSFPNNSPREFAFILEHLLLSSDGFAIHFDPQQPLFVRRQYYHGESVYCLFVNNTSPYQTKLDGNQDPSYIDIKMNFFLAENIRLVTDHVVHHSGLIPKPTEIPNERFFRYPTWHSWECNNYKSLNEEDLTKFSEMIKNFAQTEHNEIVLSDTNWLNTKHWVINQKIFSNSTIDTKKLHLDGNTIGPLMGLPLILAAFDKNASFVKTLTLRNRNNYSTTYFDFSLPETREYFSKKLSFFRETASFDTFHIRSYCHPEELYPKNVTFKKYPSMFATAYIETATLGSKPSPLVTEFGYKTQHLPIIHRMMNYFHTDHKQLLRELIPNMLSVSIGGFPFVQPYSVGGFKLYEPDPSEELMIRSIQAIALMPSMSFTRLPWQHSERLINITRTFLKLHQTHSSTIIELAKERVKTGSPIIRPLWYDNANDSKTFKINDQFMLGENILVAPVIYEGHTLRKVYFPTGIWIDQHGTSFQGPNEYEIKAPLEELPYFMRNELLKSKVFVTLFITLKKQEEEIGVICVLGQVQADVKSFKDERNETLFDLIDNYIIEITNQHRENKPKLKFSINGTKIDHIAQN